VITDDLLAIYAGRGAEAYFGEAVTVTEHSLQAALFAHRAGATGALVLAALLHDIGHLLGPVPGDIADWTSDAGHEHAGSRWLAIRFGPEVYDPVRLHVPAKRYLCTTEPSYVEALSPASIVTLRLQGGPMSRAEADAFEEESCFRDAVLLRRWDDHAKVAGLATPDFASYRPLLEALAI
jgi:gamma-butyrobetaine dioxygenase